MGLAARLAASGWSPSAALRPCIAISGALTYGLYVLSAPRHYRLENIAIILVLVAGFQQSFQDLYPDALLNSVFAHAVFIWLVHMVHVTLVRGDASYIAGKFTESEDAKLKEGGWTPVSAPELGPYHRAYKMLFNVRGIGTSWQAVKTPQQGSRDETTNKQARRRFLLRRLLNIFCRYIALAVFYEVSESGVFGWPTGG